MPETKVVKLNQPALVTAATGGAGGGCLVAFGLPFVALGAYLNWLVYAHIDRITFTDPPMPRPFLYILASIFLTAGLAVWSRGLHGIFASWRLERTMRANPDEPWWGDHGWKATGAHEHPFWGALGGLFFCAFFAAFLAPFHWWMSWERWIPGFFILAFFDLIFLGVAGAWLYGVARSIKYGAAWIRYGRFPFFLGETLDIRLGCRGSLARFDTITVTVRHVHTRKDRDDSTQLTAYQHWAETLTIDPRSLQDANELPITLTLPTGDYGTWISDDPPRYWEVEANAEAAGIDFAARFLLPVYAKGGR
jgi:hypothetical protein